MISWARWGTLALVAASASAVWFELRPGHREQILEDAALRYQRGLPYELTDVSRDDVERWFGDKMQVRVPLPHLPGATIAGARLSNLREHDAAYVVYQLPEAEQRGADRRLGLFVLDDPEREIPSVAAWPKWACAASAASASRAGARVGWCTSWSRTWTRPGCGARSAGSTTAPPPAPTRGGGAGPPAADAPHPAPESNARADPRRVPELKFGQRWRGSLSGSPMPTHVLIVDGDTALSGRVRAALQQRGHTVEETTDGRSVLERVRQRPPGVVVLAVELPAGQNGYLLVGKLKKDEALKSIPVILVGNPEGFEAHRRLKNRADEYLPRPLDVPTLVAGGGAPVRSAGGDAAGARGGGHRRRRPGPRPHRRGVRRRTRGRRRAPLPARSPGRRRAPRARPLRRPRRPTGRRGGLLRAHRGRRRTDHGAVRDRCPGRARCSPRATSRR